MEKMSLYVDSKNLQSRITPGCTNSIDSSIPNTIDSDKQYAMKLAMDDKITPKEHPNIGDFEFAK